MSKSAPGSFVNEAGTEYYKIENFDALPAFFMSIVSSSDHWLFVSSTGGLTAGRVSADYALFPYETVDKIHDSTGHTGPITLIRITRKGATQLWQPFERDCALPEGAQRNLYKESLGTSLMFEEVAGDLGLNFRYVWETSNRYGLVRRCRLENTGTDTAEIELLDGLRNLLPTGIPLMLTQDRSSLTDAYKTTQLDAATGLAVYAMTAAISDRPAPQESLRCATVFQLGLDDSIVTLDPDAVGSFRRGETIQAVHELHGRKAAYLLTKTLTLAPGQAIEWMQVAEVNQGHGEAVALRNLVRTNRSLMQEIAADVAEGRDELYRTIGKSDGLQGTADQMMAAHHAANVLFNDMRGGIFFDGYDVQRSDFVQFLETRNRAVRTRQKATLAELPERVHLEKLYELAEKSGDADFRRLTYEYLPLSFSRRHGDPSRPWNRFTIRIRGSRGERLMNYEGNWRDIFQNWEALCFSYPLYLPGIIAKFVNASTVDGFNPYRITRSGIDWEVPEPDDPFAGIGYWGDHQVVYLLRLLEWCERFMPGKLGNLLTTNCFSYADVPYRIKPYESLLKDPKDTIVFDRQHHNLTEERSAQIGTDGRLLSKDGQVQHVNLAEKLTVTALSKLSNFVPGAGVWLNTQRPEWNDANNALVGFATSMVTAYYLRRYLSFCADRFETLGDTEVELTKEVKEWLEGVQGCFESLARPRRRSEPSDEERRKYVDRAGQAFSLYRSKVYESGFSGTTSMKASDLTAFYRHAIRMVDQTLGMGRRDNGLFDAYDIIEVANDGISYRRLDDMLEGQVAVLSSGYLSPEDSLALTGAMERSGLYREDQKSYLLYPNHGLPGYFDRNLIPRETVDKNLFLLALAESTCPIVFKDADGNYRFDSSFGNAADLVAAMSAVDPSSEAAKIIEINRGALLNVYEKVFNHAQFTGRSGTMYGYEGLGCIYWHMVSKLMLAVQETALGLFDKNRADKSRSDGGASDEDNNLRDALTDAYYRIRGGISFNKTPEEYGAFPMDPYSHTPPFAGAQQPGMTGQVKEGVLARFGELGVKIRDGRIAFEPRLLRKDEFLTEKGSFKTVGTDGRLVEHRLEPGELGFSYCQVPVFYRIADAPSIALWQGSIRTMRAGTQLSREHSSEIFRRAGSFERIEVGVPESVLL